jgi:hypothetical protein
MPELAYSVRGFLTVRRSPVRIPLRGSLRLRAEPGSGLFAGDLLLDKSDVSRALFGSPVLTGTVQIIAESPVIGQIDGEGRLSATVTVNAVIDGLAACGRPLLPGRSLRTASPAVVPLRSRPGFDLARGGRVAGTYYRPPFTGGGWLTPVVNLIASGPGNAVAIDLTPEPGDTPTS